jgi:hypothetical protein
MTDIAAVRRQEADVILVIAHYVQASARLLPEGNKQRERLEMLARHCAEVGQARVPAASRRRRLKAVEPPRAPISG